MQAARDLFLQVQGESGESLARLSVPEKGRHAVGSDPAAELHVTDEALLPRHFELIRTPEGAVLKPLGPVTINGRDVTGSVRLCGGDLIAAGRTTFSMVAPQGDGYPIIRVGDTFWSVMSANAGWQISRESGLQRNVGGFLENFCMVQDELGAWPNLRSYVSRQRKLLASVYPAFAADLYQGNAHYDCAETAYLSASFQFGGNPVSQLQFYGVKHGQVGIATWSVPRELAGDNARFTHFEALLGRTYFH